MDVASIVRLLATLAWLSFIALIVVAVVRASRGRPVKALTTAIIVLGVSAILLTVVGAGLVFVQPEDRGVVISAVSPQGYRSTALEPGLHRRFGRAIHQEVEGGPIVDVLPAADVAVEESDAVGLESRQSVNQTVEESILRK